MRLRILLPRSSRVLGIAFLAFTLTSMASASIPSSTAPQKGSPVDKIVDSLFAVHDFSDVVISPDGKLVAWVENLKGANGMPNGKSAIYLSSVTPGEVQRVRISAGNGVASFEEHDVAWSPDGTKLAFLSDRAREGQLDVYIVSIAIASHTRPWPPSPRPGDSYIVGWGTQRYSVRRLTSLKGFLADPKWAPDGKTLGILFTENAPRASGPLQPMTIETGVIESHIFEQRITTVDPISGAVHQLSPADLYIYEYDWSPDGSRFAASGAHGSGDNNWWIAELYTISAHDGATTSIAKPGPAMQIAVPKWSPDGSSIAFIGGIMSDAGVTGGDIYTIPATGGEPHNITPGMKASANWLAWLASNNQILFSENVDGESGFATVSPSGGSIKPVWNGAEALASGGGPFLPTLARDGTTCAVIRTSMSQPPEVWAGPIGNWKQLTHLNAALHPAWGEVKNIHWQSDGMRVQGWLMYPRNYDPAKKYPMVVSVHGGPASAQSLRWPGSFFSMPVLSAEGYFVFLPNPRGSYGQGEEFTRGNVKDFGYGDMRDILTGVDEIVHTLPVDNNRIGVAGWSYGGFMTMWAVTQTNRFRAAIAGAGLSNWQSYYGENDIDQWMLPYFGASVYDDPAVYAKSSPINFIKNVKTPTLILVGDRDGECPVPQSYEFWHALKTQGVENQFVVYPGEGHNIGQPEHRRDIMRRVITWFNDHLKSE